MHSYTVFTLLASAAIVSAQTGTSVYPPVVASNIPDATRLAWCNGQLSACGLLCQDQKSGLQFDNTCDPDTLSYSCVCDDGKSPNATQYSQTIPYWLCTQQVMDCINNCGSDNTCVDNCKKNKKCGASDPKPPKKTSKPKSTSSDSSETSSVAGDGYVGTSTPTSTGSSDSTINLGGKGAGNSLAAFEFYSVAVIVASFGLTIFAFVQ